ncbi:MAG TPA: EF-hand domain-containing protein [Casimicrobiaceae bacterium]|nr:EF-hand domain-containing protein [Casimicrobiaceae bacterium]
MMTVDRTRLLAIAAAVAASLTGEAFAQSSGATPSTAQPTQPRRGDAAAVQRPTTAPAPGATVNSGGGFIVEPGSAAGLPPITGVTPNRAELATSAFTKLDVNRRGYVTLDDVRQLDGFASAFRQHDQNGDGRLNASEFNSAWAVYTGNAR